MKNSKIWLFAIQISTIVWSFNALSFLLFKHIFAEFSSKSDWLIFTISFIIVEVILIYWLIHNKLKSGMREYDEIILKEKKYQNIFNNLNSVIVQFDLKGNIQFFNKFAEKLYGYTANEIAGKNIFDILLPHLVEKRLNKKINKQAWIRRILKNMEKDPYGETWNQTKSGKHVYMGWTSKPVYNERKNVVGILSIGMDRTEQKNINDLLMEKELKFHEIFNSVNDGILILSESGEVLEQNNAILKAFGLTLEDIASSDIMKNLFQKLAPNLEQFIETVLEKGETLLEHEIKNAHDERMIVEIRANKINYEGKPAVLAVGRNIINKKIEQQKIFNAALYAEEKERSRVAKELHDSVSPILSAIKLYVMSLKDAKDELIKNTIISRTEETINESINSITEISNNLSPHILENFGLIEAIQSFADKITENNSLNIQIQSNIKKRITSEVEIVLYRVVIELINNTLKYANATDVFIKFIKNNHSIILNYIDNGIGFISDEIAKKSKGMGLYNITNRISSIDGNINVATSPGKGVTINIIIPLNKNE